MKKITLLILGVAGACYSQNSGTLIFNYDSAGNQTKRELEICINCRQASEQATSEVYKEIPEIMDVTYYPNPVLEQLSLKWENSDDAYLIDLNVFSISGQIMFSSQKLNEITDTIVDFSRFSEGTYIIALNYSNGEKKNLKIVKKK